MASMASMAAIGSVEPLEALLQALWNAAVEEERRWMADADTGADADADADARADADADARADVPPSITPLLRSIVLYTFDAPLATESAFTTTLQYLHTTLVTQLQQSTTPNVYRRAALLLVHYLYLASADESMWRAHAHTLSYSPTNTFITVVDPLLYRFISSLLPKVGSPTRSPPPSSSSSTRPSRTHQLLLSILNEWTAQSRFRKVLLANVLKTVQQFTPPAPRFLSAGRNGHANANVNDQAGNAGGADDDDDNDNDDDNDDVALPSARKRRRKREHRNDPQQQQQHDDDAPRSKKKKRKTSDDRADANNEEDDNDNDDGDGASNRADDAQAQQQHVDDVMQPLNQDMIHLAEEQARKERTGRSRRRRFLEFSDPAMQAALRPVIPPAVLRRYAERAEEARAQQKMELLEERLATKIGFHVARESVKRKCLERIDRPDRHHHRAAMAAQATMTTSAVEAGSADAESAVLAFMRGIHPAWLARASSTASPQASPAANAAANAANAATQPYAEWREEWESRLEQPAPVVAQFVREWNSRHVWRSAYALDVPQQHMDAFSSSS